MRPDPVATYRLQLRPDFGFREAAELIPYFKLLGISHVYFSPYLQAAAGSTHGYDVADPTRVNAELGGEEAHAEMCAALQDAGLGQMIDIVPNHMAIAGRQNPWWWDVLENGPASRYATFFDVDWEASEERWPNKVLLPVLGDHYGRVLEAGELRLVREGGRFTVAYHEHAFPVDPSSLEPLLSRAAESAGSELLQFLADSCGRLPRPTVVDQSEVERRHRDKAVLEDLLARVWREEPSAAAAIETEVARVNEDPDALDELIEAQNYRLSFWRTAGRDLGYRRFFDINDLAGLRVEDEAVFATTHALPLEWRRRGWVQGMRIDHPDGLRDPTQYFRRLREVCGDIWIVAEKILEPGEALPEAWPIEGTTGYDFLNQVNGLFHDPQGETALTQLYADLTAAGTDFPIVVRAAKHQVITELLGSELNRLTALFVAVCERHRRHRDYTRHELQEALRELAACFPVYRTYVRAAGGAVSESDAAQIETAVECVIRERPDLDAELFRFLGNILCLRVTGDLEGELAMRFQQLTGPAMAKGVEDTALYRYNRLASLNEVGGAPDRFGLAPEAFHELCAERARRHPRALLATSTHDTKRSGDVRARLALLSEIPCRWRDAVERWWRHNEPYRREGLPDRNTEYLYYQTLVGAWPIGVERAVGYMEKAAREAKVETSWRRHDETYEERLRAFVTQTLADDGFRAEVEAFVEPLMEPGYLNSLSQTLIKLTAPGVPDIYQGTELWDFSLVDPDNRRPVDFAHRARLVEEIDGLSPEEILDYTAEGLPKLLVIRQVLQARRNRPGSFEPGAGYRPLAADGEKAIHVVAYQRGEDAVTVAPRLVMGLGGDWSDTRIELPRGRWRNELTGEMTGGGMIQLSGLLQRFPAALLIRERRKS
ncbi:MAG: malto-oligosyltrehalose synthase [Candidatus Eisenbacteria bacterium]|nr:malto-oligosyltrehalose synthase [Candidatus Eisenbacteria bacterium]